MCPDMKLEVETPTELGDTGKGLRKLTFTDKKMKPAASSSTNMASWGCHPNCVMSTNLCDYFLKFSYSSSTLILLNLGVQMTERTLNPY
ncbi:hypothetical protein J6590_036042 [Homalodisca vitripennis]|nr:hypothetical protein J6590_036042 [Homalodisca vitripennis]